MKVLELGRKDTEGALSVLDQLRQAVEKGEVIGFAAVSIERDDTLCAWAATTQPVSRLRIAGAIAHLQAAQLNDDLKD